MRLLLHACCAPCAIYPIKTARDDGYKAISSFFYNPNIHPQAEFERRRQQIKKLITGGDLEEISAPYKAEEYFHALTVFDHTLKRCLFCWRLRLEESVKFAKENNFDAFTTTLLASPYQDHEAIKKICSELSNKTGITFYYRDFRVGFRDSHAKAKDMGIYCQGYCGCIFSLVEREEEKKKKIKARSKSS